MILNMNNYHILLKFLTCIEFVMIIISNHVYADSVYNDQSNKKRINPYTAYYTARAIRKEKNTRGIRDEIKIFRDTLPHYPEYPCLTAELMSAIGDVEAYLSDPFSQFTNRDM
jgi:hypothetical protein